MKGSAASSMRPEPYEWVDVNYFAQWTAFMVITWFILNLIFKNAPTIFPKNYQASAKMVQSKPGLMAYMVMIMAPVLVLSYYGLETLHIHFESEKEHSFSERIHGVPKDADKICMLQITMNTVAIVLGIIIGHPLYNKEYLVHHFMTAVSSWTNMAPYPYSLYYGTYYGGIIELTNIPLTFLDVFRNFKELRKWYPNCYSLSKASFAVSFIFVRFLGAQYVTYYLVKDWVRYFYLASYYPTANTPIVDDNGNELAMGQHLRIPSLANISETLSDIEVIDVRHHPLQIVYTLGVFIIVYCLNMFWGYKIVVMSWHTVKDKIIYGLIFSSKKITVEDEIDYNEDDESNIELEENSKSSKSSKKNTKSTSDNNKQKNSHHLFEPTDDSPISTPSTSKTTKKRA